MEGVEAGAAAAGAAVVDVGRPGKPLNRNQDLECQPARGAAAAQPQSAPGFRLGSAALRLPERLHSGKPALPMAYH